jgi:hypothetical protein
MMKEKNSNPPQEIFVSFVLVTTEVYYAQMEPVREDAVTWPCIIIMEMNGMTLMVVTHVLVPME